MEGFIHIYTGNGKGKTTAAFGLALRAAGAGKKVYIGQFIKDIAYNEVELIRKVLPEITVELFGTGSGCLIDKRGGEDDIKCARGGLERCREVMLGGEYDIIILDEILVAIMLRLLTEDEVADFMRSKPHETELVLTGRGAGEKLIALADLVTECTEIKHYYNDKGILARDGIER